MVHANLGCTPSALASPSLKVRKFNSVHLNYTQSSPHPLLPQPSPPSVYTPLPHSLPSLSLDSSPPLPPLPQSRLLSPTPSPPSVYTPLPHSLPSLSLHSSPPLPPLPQSTLLSPTPSPPSVYTPLPHSLPSLSLHSSPPLPPLP